MPIPGPRNQFGPLPGYRNPLNPGVDEPAGLMEYPRRFNLWLRPPPVVRLGMTPGVQFITRRGEILGDGFIRYYWRQAVNYVAAQAPYSWTVNSPDPSRPGLQSSYGGYQVTRALRYMTRNIGINGATSGVDNTRFEGLHTPIAPRSRRSLASRGQKVTVAGGSVRVRPTVRNRTTSFGSRVPPINKRTKRELHQRGR